MSTKNEIPFRTILSPQMKIETPSGEKIEDVLALRINEKGEEEFYIAGKKDVYSAIQAHAEDSTIEAIISRVMATGDVSILQQRKGEFLDMTLVPENIFEAQQKIKEAEKIFTELPQEIRKEYNNNFNEYLKDIGSDKWLELMNLKKVDVLEKAIENKEEKGETEE